MTKVSLMVVNYNGLDVIQGCLAALEVQKFRDFELIVLDNGSSDGSLQVIERFRRQNTLSSPAKIIPLPENRGFASGNTLALRYADASYIALLNNDAEPDVTWLEFLVKAMDEAPDVGICASKMIVHGTSNIDSAGDGFSTNLKGFKRGEGMTSDLYDKQEYIFGACAGAALYRRKMLDEIGFFDEDFFLIHEDTDLNFRAQLAGWKVFYVPSAVVHHKVRSTIKHMSDIAVYYSLRNSEFVRIKNIPLSVFFKCLPSVILSTLSEFAYFVLKHGKCRLYARAKIDVIRSLKIMMGKRRKIMGMKKVDSKHLYGMMTPVWSREFFSIKVRKFFQG